MTDEELDALETALKAAKTSPQPYTFWYCEKGSDGDPVLFVGKRGEDVKALVAAAKRANKLSSTVRMNGKVSSGDRGLSFTLTDEDDAKTFGKALTSKLTALKAIKPLLTGASATQVELVVDDEAGPALGKDIDHTKWLAASGKTGKPRSKALENVDDLVKVWTKKPPATPQLQFEHLGLLQQAIRSWLADKAGVGMREAAGKALLALVNAHGKRLKEVIAAWDKLEEMLKDDLADTSVKEMKRFEDVFQELQGYRTNQKPWADAARDAINAHTDRAMARVTKLRELEAAKQEEADLATLKSWVTAKTWTLVEDRLAGRKVDDKVLVNAIFDDFFAYGQRSWTYATSVGRGDLFTGAKRGACGTFATAFARACNLALGKKVGKAVQVSARNFYTLPLSQLGFIDPAHRGNLAIGDGGPDRFFFTEHWIADIGGQKFDPTTGRRGAAIDKGVVEQDFASGKDKSYVKDNKTITTDMSGPETLYKLTEA